jgi:quinol monooxygenase YgiN
VKQANKDGRERLITPWNGQEIARVTSMHQIVWEYEVRPDQVPAFVEVYGPTGAWARLFQGAPGYQGTTLYADTARPTHFVTLDRWTSAAALEAFLATVREAYERLDAEGADLTVRERRLGAFEFEETEG